MFIWSKPDDFAKNKEGFYKAIFDKLKWLDGVLGENEFLLGTQGPTWIDFCYLFLVEVYSGMNPKALDAAANLGKWLDRMLNLDGIKKFKDQDKLPFFPKPDEFAEPKLNGLRGPHWGGRNPAPLF